MNDNFYELCVFLGIGIIVLEIWLIIKFINLVNDASDIKSILIDLKKKSEFPYNDISKIPEYGDGIDQNGKEYFKIQRINYKDLENSYIGSFKGYICPDKKDKEDIYAIAVYNDNKVKVGYVRSMNKPLYDFLTEKGGIVVIHGFIGKRVDRLLGISNLFYGYFYIV
nr:hypothetical protein [uncultured Prevotella sp.]